MSAAVAGVGRLDVARARKLTRELRKSLQLSLSLLTEVYDGRAWEVLGYDSWAAYCATELPELAVLGKGLPPAERTGVVVALAERGLSLRGIAEPLGLAPNTVKRTLQAAEVHRAKVVGIDGRERTAAPAPAAPRPRVVKTDRTVQLLIDAGPDGLTVLDVARALRTDQHKASATLTRLQQAGRVAYLPAARRGLFGRYAVAQTPG